MSFFLGSSGTLYHGEFKTLIKFFFRNNLKSKKKNHDTMTQNYEKRICNKHSMLRLGEHTAFEITIKD